MEISSVEDWPIKATRPFIISGPCSAETEAQVHYTARKLSKTGKVSLFRAGIWKPRTRPNSFEGVGEIGLQWLVEAGKAQKLPTTTEVANAQHVEMALKAGVDVLWVGARTTVNPFSVQEIADAVKGVDIPVIIKNPINPDLQLWIGAIERFALNGINKLMAMHRGFSSSLPSPYRNVPMWEIPIALKAEIPAIPIVCDPSHICGNRHMLAGVAQKAMDLGMHGLMLESHPTPDEAWSDAKQQVTPEDFNSLIDQLQLRSTETNDPVIADKLHTLREEIDLIDQGILRLVSQRFGFIDQIGEYKKENDLTILQLDRWKEILQTRSELARSLNIPEAFITKYLEFMHKESIKAQSSIMNKGKEDELLW